MAQRGRRYGLWLLAWAVLAGGGAGLLIRLDLDQQREIFDTQARIAHRLLSQRVVQHDAILATLALLAIRHDDQQAEQRLASVYPQIVSLQRRDALEQWPVDMHNTLDMQSRRLGRAVLVDTDLGRGSYRVLLGGQPSSYLMTIDVRSMVPWSEWPMVPASDPMRLELRHGEQHMVLQAGASGNPTRWGWEFSAHKVLAAQSQPLEMQAQRHVAWSELPWGRVAVWAALVALLLKATETGMRQRNDRLRAQELLRLGQVARLNTLGELAAGMAHELNQPLTAILANTQAASRLLAEEDPDLAPIRQAMLQAVGQARRASEVVGRLRRWVEQPGVAGQHQAVVLQEVARKALYLLQPEFSDHQIAPIVQAPGAPIVVMAEPVALDQVVHNLLTNALQAMEGSAAGDRSIVITLSADATQGTLAVRDHGSGIAPAALPRLFEPFFTTREGGLGLGLSLCETLAGAMGGTIAAHNRVPTGAEFVLRLPLAKLPPKQP